MFTDPKIKVRSAGKRHLGEVIGSTSYKEDFINEKIDVRVKKRQLLFFFQYIQFTLFQTKNLQSPGTYISKRTWYPSQKAITK